MTGQVLVTTTHPVHRGPKGSGSSAGVLEDHRPGQQATAQPNLSSAHSPGCGSHQTCSGHWWGCTAFLHTLPPPPPRHHREKKNPLLGDFCVLRLGKAVGIALLLIYSGIIKLRTFPRSQWALSLHLFLLFSISEGLESRCMPPKHT